MPTPTVVLRGPVLLDENGYEDIEDFWAKAEIVQVTSSENNGKEGGSKFIKDDEEESYSISEESDENDDEDDLHDQNNNDEASESLPLEDTNASISFVSNKSSKRSSSSAATAVKLNIPISSARNTPKTANNKNSSANKSTGKSGASNKSKQLNKPVLVSSDIFKSSPEGTNTYEEDNNGDVGDYSDNTNDAELNAISSAAKIKSSSAKKRVSFGVDDQPFEEEYIEPPSEQTPAASGKQLNITRKKKKFTMTPGTYSELMKTPASDEFSRGRVVPDETYIADETTGGDETDEDAGPDDSGFTDTSFLASVRKRKMEKFEGEEPEDEEELGVGRRSQRVTKGKRFEFWKNERPVYEHGQLVGLLAADPLPKKKKVKKLQNRKKVRIGEHSDESDTEGEDDAGTSRLKFSLVNGKKKAPAPAKVKLPADVVYLPKAKCETLSVWDEEQEKPREERVVSLAELLPAPTALPSLDPKNALKKGFECLAAQTFNVPQTPGMSGWITGFLDVPPLAVKDAEGVGECVQVFFISRCQPGALEFALADPTREDWDDALAQRVILSEGDSFHVPPGNLYRLQNHSSEVACKLFWTIIKPYDAVAASE